jgi:enamine deaminase RidA (YjgF/YER057c/UK114 family)
VRYGPELIRPCPTNVIGGQHGVNSAMSSIKRIGPSRLSPTRSRSVVHAGVVTTVATSSTKVPSLYEQSRDALSAVERQLQEAGTEKSRILMAMIYITEINNKPEFNRAWDEWVDRTNLPLRACVGASLEGKDLVELVVTASIEA